ncbi:Uncharacterised protein [Yersinia enterocolitica]|nr:Uncharacterised protein [Yersinia enterocolitica]
MADNHRDARISTANELMRSGNSGKNVVRLQRIMLEAVQFTGKNIQQNF